jgi:hypothetical protein
MRFGRASAGSPTPLYFTMETVSDRNDIQSLMRRLDVRSRVGPTPSHHRSSRSPEQTPSSRCHVEELDENAVDKSYEEVTPDIKDEVRQHVAKLKERIESIESRSYALPEGAVRRVERDSVTYSDGSVYTGELLLVDGDEDLGQEATVVKHGQVRSD